LTRLTRSPWWDKRKPNSHAEREDVATRESWGESLRESSHSIETVENDFFLWCRQSFQTYVADIFLAQSWRDHRLRLKGDMEDSYRILDVDWLGKIWRPDCFFKNAKSVTFHEMSVPNHYLWLYQDKTLLYMSKYGRSHGFLSMYYLLPKY
jgi:hypothetical protein